MLKSLQSLDYTVASRILSEVVQKLLPHPETQSTIESESGHSTLHSLVLSEARERVNVNPEDDSKDAKTKLFAFLSNEISKLVLTTRERNEAIARLGERGDLNLELYKIVFTKEFDLQSHYGVRRNHVISTIRHPDSFEHLLPERFDLEGVKNISLFTSFHSLDHSDNNFILLVEAIRDRDQINVFSAWRIYPSDMDIRDTRSPLDILKAFVNAYGVEFTVGGDLHLHKFLLYEALPIKTGTAAHPLMIIPVHPDTRLHGNFFFRISPLNVIEISMAYCINLSKYALDLRKHGVRINNP